MSLAKDFHRGTKVKYKKGAEKPIGFKFWPKEWSTIYFKSYPRLPKILLPEPEKINFSLGEAITLRRSEREFSGQPLSLKDMGQLLFYSSGITLKNKDFNQTRRSYPSGGARYPLEVYLFVLKEYNQLDEGIYHYNVKENALERLLDRNGLSKEIYAEGIYQDLIKKVPVVLAISAVFERTTMKYKDRGYKYILFEAGHLGQNLSLVSTALGLKCCALGGFDDDKLNELLDIDGENEAVLYAFALGC